MRTTYSGKSLKLEDLLASVASFFNVKGFVVSVTKHDSGNTISVKASESSATKILDVCLVVEENGSLLVSFEPSEASLLIRNSVLPWGLFGGGFLTLRRQKLTEDLERLENEFWKIVDEEMASS